MVCKCLGRCSLDGHHDLCYPRRVYVYPHGLEQYLAFVLPPHLLLIALGLTTSPSFHVFLANAPAAHHIRLSSVSFSSSASYPSMTCNQHMGSGCSSLAARVLNRTITS